MMTKWKIDTTYDARTIAAVANLEHVALRIVYRNSFRAAFTIVSENVRTESLL